MMAWTEGTAKLKVRFRHCKSKRDFNVILLGVVVLLVLGKTSGQGFESCPRSLRCVLW